MSLEVYWGSGSPYAWRVLLALEIKKIGYESRRLSFTEQDLRSDEFLTVNPRGQVPAIRDGRFTLYESIAILCYLEEKYPQPALFFGAAPERGLIWRIIMECVYHLEPHMSTFAGTIFSGQLAEKRDQIAESGRKIEQELARLDTVLKHDDYLAGRCLSAADIAVYPVIQLLIRAAQKDNAADAAGNLRAIGGHYPALASWFNRIEAIPGYERTYPPHWK